jgi:hypothetical protein
LDKFLNYVFIFQVFINFVKQQVEIVENNDLQLLYDQDHDGPQTKFSRILPTPDSLKEKQISSSFSSPSLIILRDIE